MAQDTYSTLLFEVAGNVAHITLNRPEVYNALSADMARELAEVIGRCQEDADVRAVVLTGAGKAFCGGGDLRGFHAAQREPGGAGAGVRSVLQWLHQAIEGMVAMDAPVIAAVNGAAAGGGLALACACDILVAAQSARFTVAYTAVGLTPDGSSSYFLPRRIGMARALDLTLTNRALSASEALEWGLVTRLVPDADLLREADALAGQLATGATQALGAAKRLLHAGWTATLPEQLGREAESIARMADSAEGHEGIAAFVEKRRPRFHS